MAPDIMGRVSRGGGEGGRACGEGGTPVGERYRMRQYSMRHHRLCVCVCVQEAGGCGGHGLKYVTAKKPTLLEKVSQYFGGCTASG